jgi:hypothetical protein
MTRNTRRGKAAAALLLAALALGACSPVPRSTLAALHAFDLSMVSAGELRLGVRVPVAFVIDGGAPTLTISVGVDGAPPTLRHYAMGETAVPPALAEEGQAGAVIRAFALDPRSAAELDVYLAELRRTAAPGTRRLSLGLAIDGCRNDGRASGRLPVTTFIQLAPGEPFLMLTRPLDLATMAAMAGVEAAPVPAC